MRTETRLVLLYEREELFDGGSRECGARGVMPQGRKAGDAAWQPQHDAVAVAHEEVGVVVAASWSREDFKATSVERVGGIGHLHTVGAARRVRAHVIRVVEGGIKKWYRLTPSITSG